MSEQKGIPLIISLRSARERLNQQLRRLSKALSHGSSGLAHIHGHSPLELGYKRAQICASLRSLLAASFLDSSGIVLSPESCMDTRSKFRQFTVCENLSDWHVVQIMIQMIRCLFFVWMTFSPGKSCVPPKPQKYK